MAYKPDIMTLNDFVQVNQQAFTPYELWLTDELTNYLVAKRDLEKSYTPIVVDLDTDNPVYGAKDDKIFFRFNGRFFIPVEDKKLQRLNMKPEQWVELFKGWFKEQEIEVVIDESAKDVIKFTALIPVLDMPEAAPGAEETEGEETPPEGEEAPGEGEETPPEGETPSEEGEGEESAEPEETPEEPGEEGKSEETPESEEKETTPKESESKEPEKAEEPEDEELKEFEKALGL